MNAKDQIKTEKQVASLLDKLPAHVRAEICSSTLIGMLGDANDTARNAADSVLRADYWRDVRALVDDFKACVVSKEITDSDSADQWLDESIDGHSRIIYTALAAESLSYSDNADAWEEVGGECTTEQRAFYAMRRDVEDRLAADGVEWENIGAEPASED